MMSQDGSKLKHLEAQLFGGGPTIQISHIRMLGAIISELPGRSLTRREFQLSPRMQVEGGGEKLFLAPTPMKLLS